MFLIWCDFKLVGYAISTFVHVIKRETIDRIFEAAQIEEVIGEFVNLKRSGSSYKGLSPFSEERSPSFMVSPSKQIFKDFSSGKGGSVVTFLMEHEQMSYPEALRFLAEKYNIEIEETKSSPEQEEAKSHRESLYIVSDWAQKYFKENLLNSEEGKAIGYSYFTERGFTKETIDTFELGYAIDKFDAMVKAAQVNGYSVEYLTEVGLLKDKGKGLYDGFKGRVMFPIQNLSGRTLGFGGRTLKTDKKIPKYLNSPECEIYHKSKIVYGIYQAKKFIVKEDVCYLVEGYTDVISMYQAGIKNVVASSGTALTRDQVRLIGRYTKNITILYDADPAGIKASFRGIDLILAEGLNVKAALLPEGEDPDSFAKTRKVQEIESYFATASKDFILFKTQLLSEETAGDPIKKAGLIRNIIESVALIPDSITRAVYTKECSVLLDVPEKALISELNKIRLKKHKEESRKESVKQQVQLDEPPPEFFDPTFNAASKKEIVQEAGTYHQEKDILRLMLNYGRIDIDVESLDEDDNEVIVKMNLADFVAEEILEDDLSFDDPLLREIFDIYLAERKTNSERDPVTFLSSIEKDDLRELVVDLVAEKHVLHKWKSQNIDVFTEEDKIFRAVRDGLYAYKARKINDIIDAKRNELKKIQNTQEDIIPLLQELQQLGEIKRQLLSQQGIIIF
ncbi:MAG: DNA primase [Salibacteraceae bacterium]